MFPIAVGALDLEKIDILDRLGVAEDLLRRPADVATEEKPEMPSSFPASRMT